jgi:hypothetical protein
MRSTNSYEPKRNPAILLREPVRAASRARFLVAIVAIVAIAANKGYHRLRRIASGGAAIRAAFPRAAFDQMRSGRSRAHHT